MHGEREVVVLRLGHRPGRDDRMTTHIGLTARALGADRVLFVGDASQSARTVRDITDRFGGPFSAEVIDAYRPLIRDWEGSVVHLTMYGERVENVAGAVREAHADEPLLIVVGSEKVPFEVYEHADWNVGVTNQPHSEVAALAVFLDRLFEGRELDREWENADREVIPKQVGKRVVEAGSDGEDAGDTGGGGSGCCGDGHTDEAPEE